MFGCCSFSLYQCVRVLVEIRSEKKECGGDANQSPRQPNKLFRFLLHFIRGNLGKLRSQGQNFSVIFGKMIGRQSRRVSAAIMFLVVFKKKLNPLLNFFRSRFHEVN